MKPPYTITEKNCSVSGFYFGKDRRN